MNDITYHGPPFDAEMPAVNLLPPPDLVDHLRDINGYIRFGGGLHVRGVCTEPTWHSLAEVMTGSIAIHRMYDAVLPTDIPFAQDCVADQFLLRDGLVHKLMAETGELQPLGLTLAGFFTAVEADPVGFLSMQPLLRFQHDGGSLNPGEVLFVYPPFCSEESANGVSLRAVGVVDGLRYLADLSRQIAGHCR